MQVVRWTHRPEPHFFHRDRFELRVNRHVFVSLELAHCGGYAPTHGVWRLRLHGKHWVAFVRAGEA
jgi:hypothetical protein